MSNLNPIPVTARCDVVMTPRHEVYVNGTKIGNVSSLNVDQDLNGTRLTLEVMPTSLIFGEVPNETVQALTEDQSADHPTVDINRAIARAQARSHGLDPNMVAAPAVTPTAPPVPKRTPKKSMYAESAPMDAVCEADEPERIHDEGCSRPAHHAGMCR